MKKDILIIILIVVVLGLGGYLVFDNILDKRIENPNTENNNNIEENNGVVNNGDASNNGESQPIQLKNYDINSIKNIEIDVPIKDSVDPEMKKITITDKEEIKSILLNVDDAKEIEKIPEGIGFEFATAIKVNYDGDPSTNIIIMSNGNLAINKAVGVGETGYAEYEIQNKSLATELTNKYQN